MRVEHIAMATEAGLNSYRIAPGEAVAVWKRFAAMVAAKEREACALVCDGMHEEDRPSDYAYSIRARGQKEGV